MPDLVWVRVRDNATGHHFDLHESAVAGRDVTPIPGYPRHWEPRPAKTLTDLAGDPTAPAGFDLEAADAAARPSAYEPGEHTVPEVLAWVEEHPDFAGDVLAREEQGQNRSTLTGPLSARISPTSDTPDTTNQDAGNGEEEN